MLFFDRRKSKDRRSKEHRRKEDVYEYVGLQKRVGRDRRSDKERRNPKDRRSGAYYSLPEHKRDTIIKIIENSLTENSEESTTKRVDRYIYKASEFTYAELKIKEEPEQLRSYTLKVLNCSSGGIGILITKKDFKLLQKLGEGDIIKNVSLYSQWSVETMDMTVAHKTKIESGEYSGCYVMGLDSEKIIENYSPD